MKDRTWILELTDDQLSTIMEALEFTSRFHCGQIGVSYLPYQTQQLMWDREDWENSQKRRDQFDTIGGLMKSVMHKDMDSRLHSSYGVGFHEYSDELYDMYKLMRHTLHKQNQMETPDEDMSYSVDSYRTKFSNKPDIKISLKKLINNKQKGK
jgi:hypothetical protein